MGKAKMMRREPGALALVMLLAGPLLAQTPRAVAPGSAGSGSAVAQSCPTFLWSGSVDAAGYELAIYRVQPDGGLEIERQVQIEGDARGWTPAADHCLGAGSRYAWAVRAVGAGGEGPWSEAVVFSVPEAPSDDEVRRALEVLRRHERQRSDPEVVPRSMLTGPVQEPPASPQDRVPMPDGLIRLQPLSAPTQPATPSAPTITAPASFSLALDGDIDLGGAVFKNGQPFIHNDGGSTYGNTAVGSQALESVVPGSLYPNFGGSSNTAVGQSALTNITYGKGNTALGKSALEANIDGNYSTAVGFRALSQSSGANSNTAIGSEALANNTSGWGNTATGLRALANNTTGTHNSANGHIALRFNDAGSHNTASGFAALLFNESGSKNSALGYYALKSNVDADGSTAVGYYALRDNEASLNTAVGFQALLENTTGYRNTAVGVSAMLKNAEGSFNTALGIKALYSNVSGSGNTAIGTAAGYNWTTGVSNIAVGNGSSGSSGDTGTIRIGGGNHQTATFIEGISGTAVSGVNVLITAGDQLGVATSSARFKDDIRPLKNPDRLQDLRPVSFRYKPELLGHGDTPLEYGLVAEEVARVFPELVVNDADGKPYTVRYQLLTPLLLAEIQRQEEEIEALKRSVADLRRKKRWWRRE